MSNPRLRVIAALHRNVVKVFHSMEKCFAIFPHNGKNVSTLWKTF